MDGQMNGHSHYCIRLWFAWLAGRPTALTGRLSRCGPPDTPDVLVQSSPWTPSECGAGVITLGFDGVMITQADTRGGSHRMRYDVIPERRHRRL